MRKLRELKTYTEISDTIAELVRKDAALSYVPHNIYEIIEGDEYDVVIYDFETIYLK